MNVTYGERRRSAAGAAVLLGLTLGSCASMKGAAELERKEVNVPGVGTVVFGNASINWLFLEGSLTGIEVHGEDLESSSLLIFEDLNGNGDLDPGEKSLHYLASASSQGFEYSSIDVGIGDLSGWDVSKAAWEISVTKGGKTSVIGGPIN
jgi:hypothetical protein